MNFNDSFFLMQPRSWFDIWPFHHFWNFWTLTSHWTSLWEASILFRKWGHGWGNCKLIYWHGDSIFGADCWCFHPFKFVAIRIYPQALGTWGSIHSIPRIPTTCVAVFSRSGSTGTNKSFNIIHHWIIQWHLYVWIEHWGIHPASIKWYPLVI